MGTIKHDVIVVTSYDEKRIRTARLKANEIFIGLQMTTNVRSSPVNSQHTFMVVPYGSKASDHCDKMRDEFVAWLKNPDRSSYYEWFEARHEGGAKIIRHSEEEG